MALLEVFRFFPEEPSGAPSQVARREPSHGRQEAGNAAAIRDYLARERMSREQFAFKTKLGKSTVDKLLTGLYSDRTLVIVETHTGLRLRGAAGRVACRRAGCRSRRASRTSRRSRCCPSPT